MTETSRQQRKADALKFAIKTGRKPVAIIKFDEDREPNEVCKTTVYGVSELDGLERYVEHYIGFANLNESGAMRSTFPNHEIKIIKLR